MFVLPQMILLDSATHPNPISQYILSPPEQSLGKTLNLIVVQIG